MAIPRIIHQTVRDKDDIAAPFRKNIAHLRSTNSTWTYRLYDNTDIQEFLAKHYDAHTIRLWERINPTYGPAKADFFRYHLLYKLGGVYLDIKSSAGRPLDEVIAGDDEYLLSHWNDSHPGWGKWPELGGQGEYQQWHIISSAGHAFLRAVIDQVQANIERYNPARDGVGKLAVLRVTGPIAYTRAISALRQQHPHRVVDIEDLGFKFSAVATPENPLAHERYFKSHYQTSRELLIIPRRNDPCPCGSGTKYKHCHGRT